MNVCSLMKYLEQTISAFKKPIMNVLKILFFESLLFILHHLIKHWLVILWHKSAKVVDLIFVVRLLLILHIGFNRLSLEPFSFSSFLFPLLCFFFLRF